MSGTVKDFVELPPDSARLAVDPLSIKEAVSSDARTLTSRGDARIHSVAQSIKNVLDFVIAVGRCD